MLCKDVQNRIPEYQADALPHAEREAVAAHLSGCSACRRELEALDRCLKALDAAAPGAAPDLWVSFQARLAAETGECGRTAELLPAYAASELPAAEAVQVWEHLTVCRSCHAEVVGLVRSLEAIGRARETAPDLWPDYRRRLAGEITCAQAREEIFAHLDGTSMGPGQWVLEAHFEACGACAVELASYRKAEGVLARVARETPAVDLWPQFAARLDAERERRRWEIPVRAGLRGIVPGPALRPAVAFAAAAVLFWFAAARLSTPLAREKAPEIARAQPQSQPAIPPPPVEPDEPEIAAPPVVKPRSQPKQSAARPVSKSGRRRARPRARVVRRPVVRKPAPAAPREVEKPEVLARSAPPQEPQPETRRWSGLRVAFNPDIPAPPSNPAPAWSDGSSGTMSGEMARAIKSDFVQFANAIEEIRDVATDPLGNEK